MIETPRQSGAGAAARAVAALLAALGVALALWGVALAQEKQPWDKAKMVGAQDELVEAIYKDGQWIVVGGRAAGVEMNEAPPYEVPARKVEDIPYYPCSWCHNDLKVNPKRRKLTEKHDELTMEHANQLMWCTDCHNGRGMDQLVTRSGQFIDMDLSYLQCGECHFSEFKDWEFGAHGKRIGTWAGPRVLRNCTECHDPHTPHWPPAKPVPPPTVRENLQALSVPASSPPRIWERLGADSKEPQ